MKNTFVKAGLALLVSASMVACNNQGTTATTASNDSTSTGKVLTAESIVYVNSDSLLSNYEYFKDVRARFEEKAKKAQADLQSKGTAFQREVADYQKNAGTMTAEQRANTEERLARKQEELGRLNQNASSSLAQEEMEENAKLYNKVSDYLKKHSKEKGYTFVLTYSTSNPAVLYADEALEITKEVVEGLNAEYAKEQKEKE
ncbi:OmpH family outer membrane protein [Albibacterium profundi]|uniref:OmpH family outer membrane protein n=1 Tax=Albibacterium profundi TaxID=3134906 RepID=A0ABV5CG82_9SPHI